MVRHRATEQSSSAARLLDCGLGASRVGGLTILSLECGSSTSTMAASISSSSGVYTASSPARAFGDGRSRIFGDTRILEGDSFDRIDIDAVIASENVARPSAGGHRGGAHADALAVQVRQFQRAGRGR
jgi:hypothetical protein